jgi:hypothetical protein
MVDPTSAFHANARCRHGADHATGDPAARRELMLWTILVVLLVLWLLGFLTAVGGSLIHLLLLLALVVLVVQLVSGRRTV